MPYFLVAVALLTAAASAEEPIDPRTKPDPLEVFEADRFDDGGFELPYRLASPEGASKEDPRPLLLFLHGFGERGDDNQRQLIHGGNEFISESFARHRAFVVAPQCPAGRIRGVPTADPTDDPATEAHRAWTKTLLPKQTQPIAIDEPPTPQLGAARRLVDHLIATLPIDPKRVYVAGLSMGGYATWELAIREPGFWAAAVPICGGGDPRHAERLTGLPLWSFHGDADDAVPVERSREMIDALRAVGGQPIYTEYAGVGHNSWTPTLRSQQVWDWLFSQRR